MKINTLRLYYSKELAKVWKSSKSGAGSDEERFDSKWPHFKSMEFIRDTLNPRKPTSTLVSSCKFILPRNA